MLSTKKEKQEELFHFEFISDPSKQLRIIADAVANLYAEIDHLAPPAEFVDLCRELGIYDSEETDSA